MQNNSHPQHLRPGPDCASFVDALPLLTLNAVGSEEAVRLHTHLATCAYCQTQRAVYDRIDVALRRTYSTGVTSLFSPEELLAMTSDEQWPEAPTSATYDRAESAPQPERLRRHTSLFYSPLAVIAAVLVVGLLAATFAVFSHHSMSSVGATT